MMRHEKWSLQAAALAAALALALTGCGGFAGTSASGAASAASDSGAASASGSSAQGSALDDGRLRLLYGSTASTATIFCGAQPVYTAPAGGTAYLLMQTNADGTTQEARYFVSGEPQGTDQYHYAIHRADGSVAYDCTGTENPVGIAGDWVLLHEDQWSEGMTNGSTAAKFVDLATGETRSAPDAATNFFDAGGGCYVVSCTNYTDAGEFQASAYLYDTALQQTKMFENCYANEGPDGWIWLNAVTGGTGETDTLGTLYNVSTGRQIENIMQDCGGGSVCVRRDDGTYAVVRLSDGGTEAECERVCYWYAGGSLLLYNGTDSSLYYLLQRADGTTAPVYAYQRGDDGAMYLLLADSVEVYGTDGALRYAVDVRLPATAAGAGCYVTPLSDGSVLVESSLWQEGSDYQDRYAIYGKNGMLRDFPNGTYSSLYRDSGSGLLVGMRDTAGGRWVYDLLDDSGSVRLSGLAFVADDGCGDGILAARRGFEEGWMDEDSGQWLWSRGVWQQTGGEDGGTFYY